MKKFTLQLLLSILMIMGFAFNADAQVLDEDFESGAVPTDWITSQTYGSDDWTADYCSAHTGDGYTYTYVPDATLASPAIIITGTDKMLSFWSRLEDTAYPQAFDIYITEDLANNGTAVASFNLTSDTYEEYTVDMSNYDGQTVYVVFKSTDNSNYGFAIDDVLVAVGDSEEESADATLSDLTVDAVTVAGFASNNYEYDVELAFGTTVYPTVTYLANDANASASQTDDSAFPGSSVVSVTAEDGTTMLTYTINFTVATSVNTETDILTFDFPSYTTGSATTIDIDAKTVNVEVINGTSVTDLVAEFTLSAAASAKVGTTDQVSGTTANDFSSPVTYTVTAQDGTTSTDWEITVTEAAAASTDATLSDLTVDGTSVTDFATDIYVYTVVLPMGTTAIPNATGVLSDANATKMEVQATDLAGDIVARTAVVLVTAEDGTTMLTYSITFTVSTGINTVINEENITVYPNPSNGQFNISLNLNVNTVNISVVNMQGQVIANFNNIEAITTQTVDLSKLANGMYYVKISSNNNTIVKKINITK